MYLWWLIALCLLAAPAAGQRIEGTVFNQQSTPVAGVRLRWMEEGKSAVEACTDASGAYQVDLSAVTAVSEESRLPPGHGLEQNFPNPFNPGTTIPFRVGGDGGQVRLAVYNAAGQRVRALLQGYFAPGQYEWYWNGRDDEGRAVAAGMYLYRLEVQDFALQRKMLRVDGGARGGRSNKPAQTSRTFAVHLSADHILERQEQVVVAGDGCVDFRVDERFLWTQKAGMPTVRQEIAAAVLDGKVYVFGGLDDGGRSLDLVEAYDPRIDAWERKGPMPRPLNHLAAVSAGGRVYVPGGYVNFGANLLISQQMLEYDPQADRWKRKADMPLARGAHGAAMLDGKVYVVGGIGPEDQGRVMVYDPAGDAWKVGAAMPVQSEHLTMAAAGGRVYAFSGRFNGPRAQTQVYDPAADSWEVRAPIPTPRSGIASVVWLGRIHVLGGELPGVFAENEVYDPAADSWHTAPPMPTARHGLAAGVVDGKFYAIGGGTVAGLRATNAVEEYVP